MNERMADVAGQPVLKFLVGGGVMAAAMRAHDWSTSPLGPPAAWPQALRSTVSLMLGSKFPMFLAWGPDLGFLYNDAYVEILGSKHPHALGERFAIVWADAWSDLKPLVDASLAGEATYFQNWPLRTNRHGYDEQTFFTFSYSPAFDDDGEVVGMFCACNETTSKVLADRRLELERERLWTLSEDMLARAGYDGMMSAVSPAWSRVLGWQEAELLSRPYAAFMHPDDMEPTLAGLARMGETGQPTRFTNRISTRDGDWKPIEWTVVPEAEGVNFIAVGRDLSEVEAREAELASAQEALRQSQKMEAVGQLTGGLAHDFNNLLAGISGSLEMMQTRITQGRIGDVDRYMLAAQGAAKRAAALTHRLLAFSRRQTLEPRPTDVNRLVAGMEELLRRTVGPQIHVETVARGGLWSTLVDPNQLENALLNLCINARDAMPDGGKITIETGNRWLDERAAKERDLPPGQYVSMCVSDNGTGMAKEVVERAFDPFFTTKPIGVGTGLGLSMIYGFARQSGGQVRIYSEIGQGTMICVYLPRHGVEEAPDAPKSSEVFAPARSGETVLVIDDEPIVRMLVVDLLEDLGFAAIEAGDGPEGLKVIRSDARIDLLISDVGLPNGMNGRQVADAARQSRPGLKVLFVTGYAENAVLSHGHLDPGMQVVTKPFDMNALASRIKSMIATD